MIYMGFALDSKGKKIAQLFSLFDIHLVARVDDNTYSIQSHIGFDGTFFLVTFDFTRAQFDAFIEHLEPPTVRDVIRGALTNNPFTWRHADGDLAMIGLACDLGDHVHENENEQYIPFVVLDFI